jgi:dipeptidyl aminopeptidase/acylaminoacyl peptidase
MLEGHSDIFVINAEGGSPRRLTKEPFENNVPSWSRDGRWVYFSSDRTGSDQVWRVPAAGGPAVQVTKKGGFCPRESPDGRSVFYWNSGTLWRMPVEGGEESRIVDLGDCWGCWGIMPDGICFVDTGVTPYDVRFLSFSTHHVKRVTKLDIGVTNPPWPDYMAFAVSPDGKCIFYGHRDGLRSDIMLLDHPALIIRHS